tara:strand:- start:13646 stop:14470 length:825 start_codon:yes stop_codon:yes gene_type:complete
MKENNTNPINEQAPKGGFSQLGDYLLKTKSVSQRASDSNQLFPYYRAGLEQALAKRAASLYGPQGALRGAAGGAAIGALASQYGGTRGGTRAKRIGRRALKGGLGGLVGAIIGGGAGIADPETGMSLLPAALGVGLGAGVGKVIQKAAPGFRASRGQRAATRTTGSTRRTPTQAAQIPVGTTQRAAGYRPTRSSYVAAGQLRQQRLNRVRSMVARGQSKTPDIAAAATGSLAAVLAGKFYGYQSDRFERAKRGETDPYLGTTFTSQGIPGYSTF